MHPTTLIPGALLQIALPLAALVALAAALLRARTGGRERNDAVIFRLGLAAAAIALAAWSAPSLAAPWRAPWRPLPLHTYGALLFVSAVAGYLLSVWVARRDGIATDHFPRWTAVNAAAGLVGGRLLYVLTNLSAFRDPGGHLSLRALAIGHWNGMVGYGALLGAFAATIVYLRRRRLPLGRHLDLAVPAVALCLVLMRLGCFGYGCDFGRPLGGGAPAWLARLGTFPRWPTGDGAPAWSHQVRDGVAASPDDCARDGGVVRDGRCHLRPSAPASLPVHPTQLYESALGAALLAFALLRAPRRRFGGEIFLGFVFAYGIARSLIEQLRDDGDRGALGRLSTSQIIGLATAAVAAAIWIALRRRAAQRSTT